MSITDRNPVIQAGSLRERANAAREENRLAAAEYEAQRLAEKRAASADRCREQLRQKLGVDHGIDWLNSEGETAVALVEGLRFSAGSRGTLYLHGTCPRCNGDTSALIDSLADLAAQLEEFVPMYGHECDLPLGEPQTAPEPTTAERLLSALRDFIREEGGQS